MDVGVIERGIVIRVDGAGAMFWQAEGLTHIEIMGLLAIAQADVLADIRAADPKAKAD